MTNKKQENSTKEIVFLLNLKDAIKTFRDERDLTKGNDVMIECEHLDSAINSRLKVAFSDFGESTFKRDVLVKK